MSEDDLLIYKTTLQYLKEESDSLLQGITIGVTDDIRDIEDPDDFVTYLEMLTLVGNYALALRNTLEAK